uniref:U-box domain-containing protein n=1 Tax=Nelumbo nucifera TaxID=4432 RepID=A0A822YAG8_NELNU|nr:TPA_asm: hypothetical protein HUJ06_029463 [Nelumbo nucifera]
MSYCYVVMFDAMNGRRTNRLEARYNSEVPSCLNSEDSRGPISLEIMTDPVTVSTGQTYDRSSIQKWLRAGHNTCPTRS